MSISTLSGPADGRFEVVDAARRAIGECPTWDERTGTLLYVSISEGTIHAIPSGPGERTTHWLPAPVGSFGLCESARLVVALRDSVVLFDPATGHLETLASIPHPIPRMRLNDGKVGPDGAFWVGSMDDRPGFVREPIGTLYRIDANGGVRTITGGIQISNGLAWSPDGRLMYHSDSRGKWIDVWDFDVATGMPSNRRRFAAPTDAIGRPDGAAMDLDGNYWSAGVSAGNINCFSPAGRVLQSIALPNLRPTMPCFGGPDMRTLFVTSLSEGLDAPTLAANPLAGTLVATRVDATGAPVARFAA